jgi:DNA-binding response OmpR family regulator
MGKTNTQERSTVVVVIEDEPSVLKMLEDVLRHHGCTVIGFPYPEMVHTLGDDIHPDVFLVDVMLPGMSGVELAAQLRECGFANTPMIAMSASPLLLAVAAGSDLFDSTIAKPFDLSYLLDSIARFAA